MKEGIGWNLSISGVDCHVSPAVSHDQSTVNCNAIGGSSGHVIVRINNIINISI